MKRRKTPHAFALLKFQRRDEISHDARVPRSVEYQPRIRRWIDRYQVLVGRDPAAAELLLSWIEHHLTIAEARLKSIEN
jgi:hypothetical protein